VSDRVIDPGAETMGTDVPVQNVSGETKMIGSTRHSMRGPGGRWAPRTQTQIRPLSEPRGHGLAREAVTGRLVDRPSSAVLFRDDALNNEQVHAIRPNYPSSEDSPRHSNSGLIPAQDLLNEYLGCERPEGK
jgi:hypothetical protein